MSDIASRFHIHGIHPRRLIPTDVPLSTLQLETPTVVVVEYSDDAPDLFELFLSVSMHLVPCITLCVIEFCGIYFGNFIQAGMLYDNMWVIKFQYVLQCSNEPESRLLNQGELSQVSIFRGRGNSDGEVKVHNRKCLGIERWNKGGGGDSLLKNNKHVPTCIYWEGSEFTIIIL